MVQSPQLYRTAGQLCELDVTYDRLIPKVLGLTFDEMFEQAHSAGVRGINATYPYKQVVIDKVTVSDPLVRAICAVNTLIFEASRAQGFNTDYSSFMRAYRAIMDNQAPDIVCLIDTGGDGKAVAFGQLGLKAQTIRCVDLGLAKAQALAASLGAVGSDMQVEIYADEIVAAKGAHGITNCTPLGMVRIEGTPLARAPMAGASWAFDAVYTTLDTVFLQDAAAEGLNVITCYELFFGQGGDTCHILNGADLDKAALHDASQGEEA